MDRKRRRWLGWGLGALVLAPIAYHLSHSSHWTHFQWARVASLLVHLNLWLLLPAVALSGFTYVVRAYRWRCFANPLKRCSFLGLFEGQVLGFSFVYLIGRAGEIVRPAYIARKERLPLSSQLAVWVLERIYDAVAIVVLCALALYLEPVPSLRAGAVSYVHRAHMAAWAILALCAAAIILVVVFRIYSERVIQTIETHLTFLPRRLHFGLINALRAFSSGLKVIHSFRELFRTIISTAVLWIVIMTVIWLDFRCLGGEVGRLSWWSAAVIQFLAAMGLVVQLPGVGGGFQMAVLLALRGLFRVSAEAATGAAILTYLTVMVPCILMGLVVAVYEGLSFGKLQAMAEGKPSSVSGQLSMEL
jgi:glycosyltransferase 2 family protein